jgi:hypothetical protein
MYERGLQLAFMYERGLQLALIRGVMWGFLVHLCVFVTLSLIPDNNVMCFVGMCLFN